MPAEFARDDSPTVGRLPGPGDRIKIHAREILKVKGRMNELMALHTGQSLEQIERDTERDRILSAPEAVEYGLVDLILTHRVDARGATVPLYLSRAAQRCKRLAPENGICVVVCGTKNKEEVLTHDR